MGVSIAWSFIFLVTLWFYEKRVTTHLFEFRHGLQTWVNMKLRSDIQQEHAARSRSNTHGRAPRPQVSANESLGSRLLPGLQVHSNMSGGHDANRYVAL